MPRRRRSLEERFYDKVIPNESGECSGWRGSFTKKNSEAPCPVIGAGGRGGANLTARRVSYELHVGPIPPNKQVLSHCDYPPCTVPGHLYVEAVDCIADGCTRRAVAKGLCSYHANERSSNRVRLCAVAGCAGSPRARKLCTEHYRAARAVGELPSYPDVVAQFMLSTPLPADCGCAATTPEEHFFEHMERFPEDCIERTSHRDEDGYTSFCEDKGRHTAHAWAYEYWVDLVPDGGEVHHDCGNPPCVNLLHLRGLTSEGHGVAHRNECCVRCDYPRVLWRGLPSCPRCKKKSERRRRAQQAREQGRQLRYSMFLDDEGVSVALRETIQAIQQLSMATGRRFFSTEEIAARLGDLLYGTVYVRLQTGCDKGLIVKRSVDNGVSAEVWETIQALRELSEQHGRQFFVLREVAAQLGGLKEGTARRRLQNCCARGLVMTRKRGREIEYAVAVANPNDITTGYGCEFAVATGTLPTVESLERQPGLEVR